MCLFSMQCPGLSDHLYRLYNMLTVCIEDVMRMNLLKLARC